MKTAISVPQSTYARIDRAARRLKMTRSRFFVEAAEVYLKKVELGDVTKKINDFIEKHGQPEVDQNVIINSNCILGKGEW